MPSIKSVSAADFDAEVLNGKTPVLVDFWAEWCGPCKALAPTLDALAKQYDGILEIKKVDIDENPTIRDFHRVRGIPVLVLFVAGKEVARVTGTRSRSTLSRFIDEHLNRESEARGMTDGPATSKAFEGDLALKAQCEQRLRAHIERKKAAPESIMWDGEEASALGCATRKSDAEECARVLGLPTSIVTFVGSVSTYYGTHIAGAEFVLRWLEALGAGVMTSDLPRRMILCLLQSDRLSRAVGDDVLLRKALDCVIEGHSRLGEEAFSEEDWAPIRQTLREQRSNAEDSRRSVLECLENASWMTCDDDALRDVLGRIGRFAAREASARCGFTQDEERAMGSLLEETAKRLAAEGKSPREAPQVIEREMPERWKRFHEGMTYVHGAMREFGQEMARHLMEFTQALKP